MAEREQTIRGLESDLETLKRREAELVSRCELREAELSGLREKVLKSESQFVIAEREWELKLERKTDEFERALRAQLEEMSVEGVEALRREEAARSEVSELGMEMREKEARLMQWVAAVEDEFGDKEKKIHDWAREQGAEYQQKIGQLENRIREIEESAEGMMRQAASAQTTISEAHLKIAEISEALNIQLAKGCLSPLVALPYIVPLFQHRERLENENDGAAGLVSTSLVPIFIPNYFPFPSLLVN